MKTPGFRDARQEFIDGAKDLHDGYTLLEKAVGEKLPEQMKLPSFRDARRAFIDGAKDLHDGYRQLENLLGEMLAALTNAVKGNPWADANLTQLLQDQVKGWQEQYKRARGEKPQANV